MASASEYSSDDNFYGEDDEEEGVAEMDLKPCSNCGRNFNPDVLQRHFNICSKLKDRKAFDSKKQRLAELAKIPITTKPAPTTTGRVSKKKDWRWQHEQFIKNIRAARGHNNKLGEQSRDPSPTINPDYVQCPHCKRRFNEGAAERHIEFCKEQQSRIPKQIDSKYADKKEKQDKRSTYKPPLPGVKKRGSVPSATAKPRTNSNSAPSRKTKPSPSPPSHNSIGQRSTKSDTTISGHRKTRIAEARNEERPISNVINGNERYSKTNSRMSSGGSLSDNDANKMRGGKGKGGSEPKWFEELKRNDSGTQMRRTKGNDEEHNLDAVDSGMDLNENYPPRIVTNDKNSPVGIVRPSSRTNNEKEFVIEKSGRTVSSGRRKMANFCHDCGTRYPVPEAKFCCECGVKRMALV